MAGTAHELQGFAIKVGGFYDHVHLLVRIPAKIAVSDFVGQLKANNSKHINDLIAMETQLQKRLCGRMSKHQLTLFAVVKW